MVLEAIMQAVNSLLEGGKWFIQLITRTFPFSSVEKIFALAVIFLLMAVGLIVWFGGSAAKGINTGDLISGKASEDVQAQGSQGGSATPAPTSSSGSADKDGDGILNSQDYDADGDGVPNDDDPDLCINCPKMCGNSICDSFKTSAKVLDIGAAFYYPSCSSRYIIYNIPDYCLIRGGLKSFQYASRTYDRAVCLSDTATVLNPRCVYVNSSIYYVESSTNCPMDCNQSMCTEDLSCVTDQDCSRYVTGMTCVDENGEPYDCPSRRFPYCCPPGTRYAGHCSLSMPDSGNCDHEHGSDQSIVTILGYQYSIYELKNVPVNCECRADLDCSRDLGGPTCCAQSTYHAWHCYYSEECNTY